MGSLYWKENTYFIIIILGGVFTYPGILYYLPSILFSLPKDIFNIFQM